MGQVYLCVETINISCGGGGAMWRGGARGGGGRALGRIDVGVCDTRGARSRRWCGWWVEGGGVGDGGGWELQQRHSDHYILYTGGRTSSRMTGDILNTANFIQTPNLKTPIR